MTRILSVAGLNIPRISREGSLAAGLDCLLLERAGSNQGVNPAVASDDGFNINGADVDHTSSVDVAIAPDGTMSADMVKEGTFAFGHDFFIDVPAMTANTRQSASWFVKAAPRFKGKFWFAANTGFNPRTNECGFTFDLVAKTVTPYALGAASLPYACGLRELGNGWFRLELYGALVDATSTNGRFGVDFLNDSGVFAYAGDGASGFYIWGRQHDIDSPVVTSHIPAPVTQTQTRAVEVYPFNLPLVIGVPQELTLYTKRVEVGSRCWHSSDPGSELLSIAGPAGGGPYLRLRSIFSGGNPVIEASHNNGTTTVTAVTSALTHALYDTIETLVTLRADGAIKVGISINGGAFVESPFSAANALAVGWAGSAQLWLNGFGSANPGRANAFNAVKADASQKTLAQMRAL